MADKTEIAWADATWNPMTGCTKVSEGCRNCYAERMTHRFPDRHPHGFDVTLRPERLEQPRGWTQSKRIFVCSMGDLFHESVPDDFIAEVLKVMDHINQHIYMLLTKRPERMGKWGWPSNVWVGVSVEDQPTANTRIPQLVPIPAEVRFVSYEPALAGGESGPRSRRDNANWYRKARDQCVAAGTPFWFKQRSGPRPGMNPTLDGRGWQELPKKQGA